MANKRTKFEWETSYFVFRDWHPDEVWCALDASEAYVAQQVKEFFWESAEARIRFSLEEWRCNGWELMGCFGPEAIRIRRSDAFDFHIDPADVFLWFLTCGIALILQLWLNWPRHYITYSPVEVRIPARRRIFQEIKLAA